MIVMGIESSCDETGVGIVEWNGDATTTLLADEVASSVDEHARYGGVVPEVASRAHLEAIVPTMRRARAAAGVDRPDAVAVTIGPGLAGALHAIAVAVGEGDAADRHRRVAAGGQVGGVLARGESKGGGAPGGGVGVAVGGVVVALVLGGEHRARDGGELDLILARRDAGEGVSAACTGGSGGDSATAGIKQLHGLAGDNGDVGFAGRA